MPNTYSWVIGDLEAKIESDGMQNVIETVHWRLQGTDANDNVADVYGSIGLEAPDAESFIEFDSLAQSDVEGWLEANLDVDSLKAGIDSQLELIANPTHVNLQLS